MRFYHVIDSRRIAGLTIAAEVTAPSEGEIPPSLNVRDKDGNYPSLVSCAVSYCAPVEQNFSRPKGRTIARERLSSKRELPTFKRFSFITTSQNGLKAQILSCLQDGLRMGWARSLVGRELERLRTAQLQKDADTADTMEASE